MRIEELDKKIAANLIVFRKALGLSQRQFALRAKIDQAHLNKIESAQMSITFTNLHKISETYNVEVMNFFNFENQEKSELQQQAISLISSMEEWKLKIILSLIKELKSVVPD